MKDNIVLVDDFDNMIGTGEKLDVHRQGLLHRAFSLFIYDASENKLLIQQRAQNKYHSGGLWANACCSHPRKGEDIQDAVLRRTKEELGIMIPKTDIANKNILELGKFKYYKDFGNVAEYEIDHVFVWFTSIEKTVIIPNKKEITDIRWIKLSELKKWMNKSPEDFTAWLPRAYKIFQKYTINL